MKYLEDFLILGGLLLIIIATFFVSKIAFLYVTGIIFIILGIYFSKNPLRSDKK